MTSLLAESAHLTESQFQQISQLVKQTCGINLHDGKKELVKARLAKRLRQTGLGSFEDYLNHVRDDDTGAEMTSMLDSISTNLTQFFRENAHFEFLKTTLIPALAKKKREQAKLRIWSAGCSSGEEPYSLGILLRQEFPELVNWDIRILATDLSTRVLAKAREGVYDHERLRDVPSKWISDCFTRLGPRGRAHYKVNNPVRQMITFGRLNLMERWPMRGPFDVIFCRNVMIYFDKPTQGRLVQRYWDILDSGGMLFVGHSESLTGTNHRFKYVQPAVYQKP